MNRLKPIHILSLVALLLSGCGHMRIQTNQPGAQIYVDGDFVGMGSAKVRSIGPPGESRIRVVYNGIAKERTVEREFRFSTAIVGLVTYLTGFYWAWQYPEHVMIRLPDGPSMRHPASNDAWTSGPAGDPWSQPLFKAPKPASTKASKPGPSQESPKRDDT